MIYKTKNNTFTLQKAFTLSQVAEPLPLAGRWSKAFTLAEVPEARQHIGFWSKGFTLAEILITLAIIGIVAAMTIPTLVTNYQKKQTVTKLRKVFSDLNNVVKFSEIDNGPMSIWKFPTTEDHPATEEFVKTYYLPYYKSAKFFAHNDLYNKMRYRFTTLASREAFCDAPGIILSDGTILAFQSGLEAGYLWVYADINGLNPPNRLGKDIFIFDAYRYQKNGKYYVNFWTPHGDTSKRDLYTYNAPAGYGCDKDNTGYYSGWYCGALIQFDGWQIRDDYPW